MEFELNIPTCIICYSVCKIPQIDSCGHTLCKECLIFWMKNSSFCPISKQILKKNFHSNQAIEHFFNSHNSPCGYSNRGCSWVGNIKHLKKYHWDKCVFSNHNHVVLNNLTKLASQQSIVKLERIEMNDGSVFEGLLDDKKSFKFGVLKKENEYYYEGTFENNKMSGKFYDKKAKLKFEGQFLNGKMHGYIVVLKKNRLVFEGVFEHGNALGSGIAYETDYKVRGLYKLENSNTVGEVILTKGLSFKGVFRDFLLYKGIMTYTDGKTIEATFKKGKANERGRIVYPDGNIYEGEIADDLYEGEGKLLIASKSLEYYGFFSKGKKNGLGKVSINGSFYYQANFVSDEINGRVVFYRNEGARIEIELNNGKMISEAEMSFCDGSIFKSNMMSKNKLKSSVAPIKINFDSNVFEISFYGTLTYKNQDQYEGEIIGGSREREGRYTFANGDVFTGTYVQDKAEGDGKIEFKKNSMELRGTWKNNLLEGKFLLSEKKRLVQKQQWRNGQLIATYKPSVESSEKRQLPK